MSNQRIRIPIKLFAIIGLYVVLLTGPTKAWAFDTTTNSPVFAMAQQADGKILLGGAFSAVFFGDDSVVLRNRLVRLNLDGSLDDSFDIGSGANGTIFAIALQADGKILIGGDFEEFNNIPRVRIARLNTNGSVDSSFSGGSGFNDTVLALTIQADGKIVTGGDFDTVQANPLNRIARLNTDSSVDQDFDPGQGANARVRAVALQNDGKIVIGGDFTTVNQSTRGYFARLNTDGSLDSGVGAIARANAPVHDVTIQNDGRILVGGEFTQTGFSVRNRIARVFTNGELDTGFSTGSGANSTITKMALQPSGKIVIGGLFTVVRGNTRNRIARLNTDSSVDATFDLGAGPDDNISSLLSQLNDKVLIGGFFANIGNVNRPHLARLRSNGRLDLDSGPENETCFPVKAANGNVVVNCL
ncbi:MAG: delta-60 repeat domain-containing protein [Gammaproteobacteria bacterium]|nr:delta-60 repeat domain-containing protein [Gammaproteobacteria bacterium]